MNAFDLLQVYKTDKKELSRLKTLWSNDSEGDQAKLIKHTVRSYSRKWDKLLTSCATREQAFVCKKALNMIKGWWK